MGGTEGGNVREFPCCSAAPQGTANPPSPQCGVPPAARNAHRALEKGLWDTWLSSELHQRFPFQPKQREEKSCNLLQCKSFSSTLTTFHGEGVKNPKCPCQRVTEWWCTSPRQRFVAEYSNTDPQNELGLCLKLFLLAMWRCVFLDPIPAQPQHCLSVVVMSHICTWKLKLSLCFKGKLLVINKSCIWEKMSHRNAMTNNILKISGVVTSTVCEILNLACSVLSRKGKALLSVIPRHSDKCGFLWKAYFTA